MKYLMLFLFTISSFAQAPDSIRITPERFTEVIVQIDSTESKKIFEKISAWINQYYNEPNEVILAKTEYSYIRWKGKADYFFRHLGGEQKYSVTYQIEVNLKDNKYKLAFLDVNDTFMLNGVFPKDLYNKSGGVKGNEKINYRIRKGLLNALNKIHFEIYNYIKKDKEEW